VFEMVTAMSFVMLEGLQSMGQRTPCLATAWKASSRRRASRTERPTVRLLSVTWRFEIVSLRRRIENDGLYLLYHSLLVQYEHPPQTDSLFFDQNPIIATHLVAGITKQRDFNLA
jgi:hypothetical protein